ncbi:hypothetical protein HYV85_04400 [Candidatus Woesearchaeota archaeon]|nr:hypothetical protein [Candidatus Woesearchaeota archaeon]
MRIRFLLEPVRNSILRDIVSLTYEDIARRRLITPFVIFVAFLISFTITRGVAYAFPSVNLIIGRYHIHHFYYGIILMIASNWIALVSDRPRLRLFAAALFGFGLGIIADEIGLLLTCTSSLMLQCNYYERITLDFFTIMVGIFLSVLYFVPVWRRFRRLVGHTHRFVYRKLKE